MRNGHPARLVAEESDGNEKLDDHVRKADVARGLSLPAPARERVQVRLTGGPPIAAPSDASARAATAEVELRVARAEVERLRAELAQVRSDGGVVQPLTVAAPQKPELEVLLVSELAELLRLEPKSVYDLVARGEIPGVRKVGGALRAHRPTIIAWLAGRDGGARPNARRRR